jgi:hypothetical protein
MQSPLDEWSVNRHLEVEHICPHAPPPYTNTCSPQHSLSFDQLRLVH